jgi:Chaperone of endosialidase
MKKTLFTLVCSLLAAGTFGQSVLLTPNALGNIGINNTNPQNNLQIGPATSPAFIGNEIAIGNAAGGGMSFSQNGSAGGGNSIWYSNSNFSLMPAANSFGRVGIGTLIATTKLDVRGLGPLALAVNSYISNIRVGILSNGNHDFPSENSDAIGIVGYGGNANNTRRNIGLFGTTDNSGAENIGLLTYQKGNFTNLVYGSYNDVTQTGTGAAFASFNKINNSQGGTNNGVYSEVTSTKASGFLSNFGVTSVVSTNAANTSAANYGFYANAVGGGTNYGVFASASGGVQNYAVAAYGNSFFEENVAIGATSIPALPLAKLVVTGFKGTSAGTSSFFNPGSAIYTNTSSGSNNSIYATHGIVSNLYIGAALSVIASDNRIKNIKGISNSAADLARLRKIEITDYTMKDAATWGNQTFKKVIAQQVESVYPEVIKLQTSVIPDIYALAESVVYDAATKNLSVTLSKEYNIKIGEKIELVHPEKDKILAEVIAVNGNNFTVKDWAHATDKIFVFGREVNDFRSVDYEALSMLGISSIQQLAKENEELRSSNEKLRITNYELRETDKKQEAKNLKTEARLEAIENLLKSNVPTGK